MKSHTVLFLFKGKSFTIERGIEMKFTEQQERLVFIVLDEIIRKPTQELRSMFGTCTIDEIMELYDRMKLDDYCQRHGVEYENLTEDDRMTYADEMWEEQDRRIREAQEAEDEELARWDALWAECKAEWGDEDENDDL